MNKYFIILIIVLTGLASFGQGDIFVEVEDSTSTLIDDLENHSPVIASALSAIVPGAGQVYNRKYWKLPIVYAGLGVGYYFFSQNYTQYKAYKEAYIDRQHDILGDDFSEISDAELESRVASTHKNYELAIVGTLVVYVLNIVDASVDAHLFYFDISDDLSMNIQPTISPMLFSNRTSAGLSLTFNF
jgi:hypothetical protein